MSVIHLRLLAAYVEAAVAGRLRRNEDGSGTLEKIVIAAIAVAAAIAAGTIIYNLAVDKANSIDTTTP